MSGKALENDLPDRSTAVPTSAPSLRRVSIEERRRLVAESLQVGNPSNNARELPTHADPSVECQIELAVEDIRPYENNPRRAGNARFAEIKESIRASGIRNPLTVTRRPGEAHFIVETGGNTRLIAIQQLWVETRDSRFRRLTVLFRPWRSESHVLSAHLIENEQRGEMTFWDKASGIVALKARLEAEKGRILSLRQLEEELSSLGLSVNTATLAHYLFATERLGTLGEAVPTLSGLDVKSLQPRLNAMKRYAHLRASVAEEDLYATVFEQVFRGIADEYPRTRSFSATAVRDACEEALARRLGEPIGHLRNALDSPARVSDVSTANSVSSDPPPSRVQARPSPRTDSNSPNPSKQLTEQVRTFAAMAGIDDCVRLHQAAPCGFCLEALPRTKSQAPARQRAWSLLAAISGQLEDPAPAVPLDSTFFDWLADPDDAMATAFWYILSLARELRSARNRRRLANPPAPTQEDA